MIEIDNINPEEKEIIEIETEQKVKQRFKFLKTLLIYRIKTYNFKRLILDLITLFLISLIVRNIVLNPHIILVYIALFINIKLNKY